MKKSVIPVQVIRLLTSGFPTALTFAQKVELLEFYLQVKHGYRLLAFIDTVPAGQTHEQKEEG